MSMPAPRRSHIRAMVIKYSSLRGQNNGVVPMQLKRCKEEQRQGGEESMAQDNGQTFAKSVRKTHKTQPSFGGVRSGFSIELLLLVRRMLDIPDPHC